jgi:pimeloyl-ACP methyl ester carboxylesterase
MPNTPIIAAAGGLALALGGFGLSKLAVRRRERFSLEEIEKPGRVIDVDGQPIHYEERGAGPVLLLLHGFGACTFSFRRIVDPLSEHYRVVAPDLLGFGYSARPTDGDYTLTGQARLVGAFMETMGIARATVLGHSMGGGVAIHLAAARPERVDRLVLVGSLAEPFNPPAAPAMRLAARFFFACASRSLARRTLRRMVHDPELITDEVVEGYYRPDLIKGTTRARYASIAELGHQPPLPLAAVKAPAIVFHGDSDPVIKPVAARKLAETLNAPYVELQGTGHLPPEERPELLVAELSPEAAGSPATAASSAHGKPRTRPAR